MEISKVQAHIEDWLEIRPLVKQLFEIRADGRERFGLDAVVINIRSVDKWNGEKLIGKMDIAQQELKDLDYFDKELAHIIQELVIFPHIG